jgi:hypothetical protein
MFVMMPAHLNTIFATLFTGSWKTYPGPLLKSCASLAAITLGSSKMGKLQKEENSPAKNRRRKLSQEPPTERRKGRDRRKGIDRRSGFDRRRNQNRKATEVKNITPEWI